MSCSSAEAAALQATNKEIDAAEADLIQELEYVQSSLEGKKGTHTFVKVLLKSERTCIHDG
jgi:hypothetical protein